MGVIGGGISINGPSGIDTASLVDQLTALEQQKVTTIEDEKKKYQVQIDAYSKFKSVLATLASKSSALDSADAFDVFASTSSNKDIVTLKGDVGAAESTYDISVSQLARNEKMISKSLASQTASLFSQGITVGDISIDGTTITIDSDDTIQDMRMKINNATDTNGNKLNVSASVLKVSSTEYRLVLTAKKTGSTGVDYQDVGTATTLKGLGIITGNGVGNKGNVAQVIQSQLAENMQTTFDGLGAGDSIQLSGTDRDGNAVTHTYIKPTAGTSIDDFIAQVKQSFHDMADVSIDSTSNRLVIADKITGKSQLAINSFSITKSGVSTNNVFATTAIGADGAGVLSTGKDAYFNVDSLALTSSDNNASGAITGVTIELHKASSTETVQTSLTRDTDAIQQKVQDLIDAYNGVLTFVNDNTKMADPNDSNSKAGDLAGDTTAKSILAQVRNQLQQSMSFLGGTHNSLTMFGVKSDAQSGQMSLDKTRFNKAVTNNFSEMVRFFVTNGTSDNGSVAYGRSTKDTQSGSYTLQEQPDNNHLQIQLSSSTTWSTSDFRSGDIVTFSSGPAKGLSITAASGVITTTSTFTFSKGLGDRINQLITGMNDPQNGMITIHQSSLQSNITSANDRVTAMQKRVDDYHDRMVKQFAAMENALQKMKTQETNMLSALGTTSSSS
jgi:flagellar capping protein FliD